MVAAQVTHAAGESVKTRVPPGTYAVVLGARDLAHIEAIEQTLRDRGVPHVAIRENAEPHKGELMAIGIEPALRSKVKRHVSSIPLLR